MTEGHVCDFPRLSRAQYNKDFFWRYSHGEYLWMYWFGVVVPWRWYSPFFHFILLFFCRIFFLSRYFVFGLQVRSLVAVMEWVWLNTVSAGWRLDRAVVVTFADVLSAGRTKNSAGWTFSTYSCNVGTYKHRYVKGCWSSQNVRSVSNEIECSEMSIFVGQKTDLHPVMRTPYSLIAKLIQNPFFLEVTQNSISNAYTLCQLL